MESQIVKPIVLGFQTVRVDTSGDQVAAARRRLSDYAEREGLDLAEVFVEDDINRPGTALAALISFARQTRASALLVPSAADLGRLPYVQRTTRSRIEREAGLSVLVVDSSPRTSIPRRK